MIGGCESIRDIQESKDLSADAYEFPLVESVFALRKIVSAIHNVFEKDAEPLNNQKLFINIETEDGIKMLNECSRVKLPYPLEPTNIIFNFNRISLADSIYGSSQNDHDGFGHKTSVNQIIVKKMLELSEFKYSFSISGGVNESCISELKAYGSVPTFVRTGLFTFNVSSLGPRAEKIIKDSKNLEKNTLQLLNGHIDYKYNTLK